MASRLSRRAGAARLLRPVVREHVRLGNLAPDDEASVLLAAALACVDGGAKAATRSINLSLACRSLSPNDSATMAKRKA